MSAPPWLQANRALGSAAGVEAGSASANSRTASSVGAMVTSIPRLRRASSVAGSGCSCPEAPVPTNKRSGSSSRTSSRSSRTREWPWARHQFGTTRSGRMITPREKKILRLLATGSTSQEVAFQLGMPLSTTKRGITRIYSKLEAGASSRFARSFRHAAGKTSQRKETNVSLQVTAIMLGVEDVARSKAFYEALGCAIDQDHPTFVSFSLGEGSSSLALYPRDAAAQDAGVSPEGSGFQGVSFHYIVGSNDEVDEVIGKASNGGGKVVKEAAASQWGGYFGYFSDPADYLWKVATSS